jgi:hypothetical protein
MKPSISDKDTNNYSSTGLLVQNKRVKFLKVMYLLLQSHLYFSKIYSSALKYFPSHKERKLEGRKEQMKEGREGGKERKREKEGRKEGRKERKKELL